MLLVASLLFHNKVLIECIIKEFHQVRIIHFIMLSVATTSSVIPSIDSATYQGDQDAMIHGCSKCGHTKGVDSDINSRIDRLSRLVDSFLFFFLVLQQKGPPIRLVVSDPA